MFVETGTCPRESGTGEHVVKVGSAMRMKWEWEGWVGGKPCVQI